jgi:hypothetical protein
MICCRYHLTDAPVPQPVAERVKLLPALTSVGPVTVGVGGWGMVITLDFSMIWLAKMGNETKGSVRMALYISVSLQPKEVVGDQPPPSVKMVISNVLGMSCTTVKYVFCELTNLKNRW